MRFVDTNILLYRVSADQVESEKQKVAGQLLGDDELRISIQVLQEFYVQATCPSRPDTLNHEEAVALMESWKRFAIQETTIGLLDAALVAKDRWKLSYGDAAIIEAARLSGCDTVLSEDLNPGQNFNGVRVQNPFV